MSREAPSVGLEHGHHMELGLLAGDASPAGIECRRRAGTGSAALPGLLSAAFPREVHEPDGRIALALLDRLHFGVIAHDRRARHAQKAFLERTPCDDIGSAETLALRLERLNALPAYRLLAMRLEESATTGSVAPRHA